METRSAKRKRKLAIHHHHHEQEEEEEEEEEEEDRISDLPDDILHQILTHLPIKSVAQTSVLSKRFNTLWHSYPDLDFTSLSPLSPPKPPSFLPTLLLRHSDIRLLRFRASLTFSRLASLVRHAVRRNVQHLDVEVSTSDYFNFPRSIITSPTIRLLRLKSWHPGFRLPPLHVMKSGFPSLSALSLSRPVLHDRPSLVDLFTPSSFPLLTKLHLENCFGMTRLTVQSPALLDFTLDSCFQLQHLDVRVPKLQRLSVSSCFDPYVPTGTRVSIDCPNLLSVVWSYNAVTDECSISTRLDSLHDAFVGFFRLNQDTVNLSDAKIASVSNLLAGVSGCRSLTLETQCVEIISKSNRVSLCRFDRLKSLELSTGFDKHNNPGLANLFRSSPNVHTIVIKIVTDQNVERRQWNKDLWQTPSSGEERYWESQTQYLKSFLRHLKVVKIHGFTECANDISLVKFFLKQGKVLQDLFLCTSLSKAPRDSLLREKIKSQIMGFSRASSNANIVFQ